MHREAKKPSLAAFLRLSLPRRDQPHPFPELAGCAMIREVHVYGPALNPGDNNRGEAQHTGLGTRLVERAKEWLLGEEL